MCNHSLCSLATQVVILLGHSVPTLFLSFTHIDSSTLIRTPAILAQYTDSLDSECLCRHHFLQERSSFPSHHVLIQLPHAEQYIHPNWDKRKCNIPRKWAAVTVFYRMSYRYPLFNQLEGSSIFRKLCGCWNTRGEEVVHLFSMIIIYHFVVVMELLEGEVVKMGASSGI